MSKELGAQIKYYRNQKRMTQEELAQKVGLATITIRQYESGAREPNASIVEQIASALGVTRYELENPQDVTGCEFAEKLREKAGKGDTAFDEKIPNVIMSIYDTIKSEENNPPKTLEKTVQITELCVKALRSLSDINDAGLKAVIENIVKQLNYNQKRDVICGCIALQGVDVEKIHVIVKIIDEISRMPQYLKEYAPNYPVDNSTNK